MVGTACGNKKETFKKSRSMKYSFSVCSVCCCCCDGASDSGEKKKITGNKAQD